MIKNISNLGDAALYCDFGNDVNREINLNVIHFFKNIKKSLVGNGRLIFVCWSNREENDWINLSSNVASQFLELPPKANPKDPGPFAFEDYFYIKEISYVSKILF